jgi:hypothetical protein
MSSDISFKRPSDDENETKESGNRKNQYDADHFFLASNQAIVKTATTSARPTTVSKIFLSFFMAFSYFIPKILGSDRAAKRPMMMKIEMIIKVVAIRRPPVDVPKMPAYKPDGSGHKADPNQGRSPWWHPEHCPSP